MPATRHVALGRTMLVEGECAVNSQIAGIVGSREIGQTQPVVHRRPERPIGKTIIVFLTIERRQVHQRVLNPPLSTILGWDAGWEVTLPLQPNQRP